MAERSWGGRTAMVIGGRLAGVLAVSALVGQVDAITVVERDRYPAGRAFRKDVPQARHLHILLSGGQRALEEVLPGTVTALGAAGARSLYLPRDLLTRTPTGWQRRFDERRHLTLSVTRPVLDTVVRERALRAAAGSATRVEVLEATEAIGLTGDAGRVTGVRVRSRDGEPGARSERELRAALVVDASGRGSRTPQWFAALGAPAVRTTFAEGGGLRPGITAEAQRAVARAAEPAWLAAVGSDRPYAGTADTTVSLGERLTTWYLDRLAARAAIDPVVGAAFRDVFCLTAPPARLVAPQIFLRTVFLPRRPGLPGPPAVVEGV